jgi:triosephosphate isomerase
MSVAGVSLKLYFGVARTRAWLEAVAELQHETELFVLPSFVSLPDARDVLAGTRIGYGAQDVFWADGAYTGEVSVGQLQELGCTYAEVGHAERRAHFGETDAITARKAVAAAEAGLTPIVCIDGAAQMDPVLDAVPHDADLIFAYEPIEFIGAAAPAPTTLITDTALQLKQRCADRPGRTRLIYGGSAGPGLYSEVAGAVDGLFLGRFAHDIDNLRTVLAEMASVAATC